MTAVHLIRLLSASGVDQLFASLSEDEQDRWGNGCDGLAFVVSDDSTPGSASAHEDANHGLLRLAAPALRKATGNHPGIAQITRTSVGIWYLAYIQQRILVALQRVRRPAQRLPGRDRPTRTRRHLGRRGPARRRPSLVAAPGGSRVLTEPGVPESPPATVESDTSPGELPTSDPPALSGSAVRRRLRRATIRRSRRPPPGRS